MDAGLFELILKNETRTTTRCKRWKRKVLFSSVSLYEDIYSGQSLVIILTKLVTATIAAVKTKELEMATLPLQPSDVQQLYMTPEPDVTVLYSEQPLVAVYERVTYDTLPPAITVYFYDEHRRYAFCSFNYTRTYFYSPCMNSQKHHLPQSASPLDYCNKCRRNTGDQQPMAVSLK